MKVGGEIAKNLVVKQRSFENNHFLAPKEQEIKKVIQVDQKNVNNVATGKSFKSNAEGSVS